MRFKQVPEPILEIGRMIRSKARSAILRAYDACEGNKYNFHIHLKC